MYAPPSNLVAFQEITEKSITHIIGNLRPTQNQIDMVKLGTILWLTLAAQVAGFAQIPLLKGRVHISLKQGLIKADWDVSSLPDIANYSIWLNSGFNIGRFTDSTGLYRLVEKKIYNPDQSEEAFQYFFDADQGEQRRLPPRFRVSYVGSFPVYADTTQLAERGDDSGRIAFNGTTLRAADQSSWYPMIYDIAHDDLLADVRYDIEVTCIDCQAMYLNGDAPKSGPSARFVSNKAVPLFLLVGQFQSIQVGSSYFINNRMSQQSARLVDRWISRIKAFYQQQLRIPYQQTVYGISATPVTRKDAWMVSRYPTIAVIGHHQSWQSLINEQQQTLADSMAFVQFIGHELGHYYFGYLLMPNGDLKYTFLEGCTEYMALQLVRELLGETYYHQKLATYHDRIGSRRNFRALTESASSEPLSELQHYVYVPLLLTSLEKMIGQKAMWQWLSYVLKNPPSKTDYRFFKTSLLKSGMSEAQYMRFEQQYVTSGQAVENVMQAIKP